MYYGDNEGLDIAKSFTYMKINFHYKWKLIRSGSGVNLSGSGWWNFLTGSSRVSLSCPDNSTHAHCRVHQWSIRESYSLLFYSNLWTFISIVCKYGFLFLYQHIIWKHCWLLFLKIMIMFRRYMRYSIMCETQLVIISFIACQIWQRGF